MSLQGTDATHSGLFSLYGLLRNVLVGTLPCKRQEGNPVVLISPGAGERRGTEGWKRREQKERQVLLGVGVGGSPPPPKANWKHSLESLLCLFS